MPALRQCPDFDVGQNLMGIALFELGRLEEAVGHFTAAVRLDSKASVGWANRKRRESDTVDVGLAGRRC
jgi:tetratricopeptide (TPR) repeat protein